MSETPWVGCVGLTKSFGSQPVLRGLDMRVQPGRVYALLGRNGAGKSTTLKIMLGLLEADAGQGFLFGEPFVRPALARVGASIDGPAVYPHLSARDNLRVHALLTGSSPEQVDTTLAQVGLAETGGKRAKSFSTGMKGRLALAIALLTQPDLLVLDEPQNGLDPEGIVELRRSLRDYAASGRTVNISSHQLGEVTQLADDIGVMNRGTMAYEGPLEGFAHGDLEDAFLAATQEQA
ncbi:MAG: ATP-binding cassette domain-containing protein [Propionicimonas sp.]|nr:ATP-binding cassette domain-containing protein [Propionicimonas sp.]